jgi:ATP-binding cassette subfamily C protein
MMGMIRAFMEIVTVIPAYKRCKPILDTLPEYEEEILLPGNLTGDIEVSNVTFAYDKEDGNVLNELSFHVKAGEYIGIVGSSGCGKSTLLKILLGFEKPQQGKVFYDGRDIDSMDKRELRKKFGVVLQDGNLISGSIYDNIVITAPNATMQRVEQVIKEIGLKEDIDKMPMGLHTVLSESGGSISGGQLQRILIARAIVGKPKILFFDEATSALDNVTQSMVCESLKKLRGTKLVIAHRLSTIVDCDRILVMEQGRIVEDGTYDVLMQKKGLFYELVNRQIV